MTRNTGRKLSPCILDRCAKTCVRLISHPGRLRLVFYRQSHGDVNNVKKKWERNVNHRHYSALFPIITPTTEPKCDSCDCATFFFSCDLSKIAERIKAYNSLIWVQAIGIAGNGFIKWVLVLQMCNLDIYIYIYNVPKFLQSVKLILVNQILVFLAQTCFFVTLMWLSL